MQAALRILNIPDDLRKEKHRSSQLFRYYLDRNGSRTHVNICETTFSFIRSGSKEIKGSNKEAVVYDDSFLLVRTGNCFMTENVSEETQDYLAILLAISDEEIISFLSRNQLYSNKAIDSDSFYIFKYDDFLDRFLDSLEEMMNLPHSVQDNILRPKINELLTYICHAHGPELLISLVQNVDSNVQQLVSVVESNKYNVLTLEDLAFLCNRSVSSFKRDFFKEYGETPMKWFHKNRMDYAAYQIKSLGKKPIQLYKNAGYDNLTSFLKAFKKEYGITPREFQQKHEHY